MYVWQLPDNRSDIKLSVNGAGKQLCNGELGGKWDTEMY